MRSVDDLSGMGFPEPDFAVDVICVGNRLREGESGRGEHEVRTSHPDRVALVGRIEHLALDPALGSGRHEQWAVIPINPRPVGDDRPDPRTLATIDAEGNVVDPAEMSRRSLMGDAGVRTHAKKILVCDWCALSMQISSEWSTRIFEALRAVGRTEPVPLWTLLAGRDMRF